MKKWRKLKDEKWFPNTVALCSAVILFFLLSNIVFIYNFLAAFWKVISPVIYGIMFAYVMDPIARFFERIFTRKRKTNAKLKRGISAFLATFVVIICFALLVFAVIPPLIESATGLYKIISSSWDNLQNNPANFSVTVLGKTFSFDNLTEIVNTFVEKIAKGEMVAFDSVLETSYGFGSGVVTVALGLVLAIYFMIDKVRVQKITKKVFQHLMKEKKYDKFSKFCHKSDRILLRYLACDLAEALIVGTSNAIFMACCGLPYIGLISVIVGITNLAPTFGPICGAVIGSALLLIIDPWYALWFLIFTAIIQTVDGYILKPKFFGDTLGVSPLLILITIIVGGRLFGALGIILSIPFTAIVQCFVKDYFLTNDDADTSVTVEDGPKSEEQADSDVT